ncbi:di-N-acetylchitobiase-like [Heptranchias perlo]|uniref:di-N-acetylchitobiase-like n=1 Tax=Heptranchias perlo TaxID=212740 RepID=UPI0035598B0E
MRWSLELVQALVVLVLWVCSGSGTGCPCSDRALCEPVTVEHEFEIDIGGNLRISSPAVPYPVTWGNDNGPNFALTGHLTVLAVTWTCPCTFLSGKLLKVRTDNGAVFVFDVGGKDWKYYDWFKVTTIAAFGPYDPELLCYAHANQVRVVLRGVFSLWNTVYKQRREKWVDKQLQLAKRQFMDGINLDVNIADKKPSIGYFKIPQLVSETMDVFHREIPGSQVTFNVPWSPDCIDGRCYDFLRIANSCDFLFVMSYDMQSQMWDNCFAKANAPYYQTLSGYSAYINLGIDSRKLVLGVPWYGYDYPCTQFFETGRCVLEKIPFRGAPCSNAAGRQVPYKEIVQHVHKSITGRYWDDEQKVPSYIYMVNNTFHEVWYDDPQSISIKSAIMKKLRLRGIGMWNGNMLNYSDDHFIVKQTEDMWNALCPL